ncbi:MAG: hypothetical protein ACYS8Z_05750 [Planctomycetota bacterium]|jgi:hypothetical protein
MNCPKCSHENDPDASICSACGIELPQTSDPPGRLDVRVSQLGVSSFCLSLIAVFLLLFVEALHREVAAVFVLIGMVLAVLGFILGIGGLICIEKSYGRLGGRGFAAIGIAIPVIGFFLTGGFSALTRTRCVAYPMYCGTNLSGIGKAMLIYSNDYDDELPRAGGKNTKWGPTPNWQARTPAEAYGLGDGQASISASLYLLVKYAEVTPKSFVCKGDVDKSEGGKSTTEFTLAEYNIGDDIVNLHDFGPEPSKHCSYTYHLPYGEHRPTSSSDPGMAVAADRNPWLDTYARKARSAKDWSRFDPNGSRESIKLGNTFTHQGDGQNVLFIDGHTSFEKQPNCGVNGDNIYTSQEGIDIEKGALPTMTSRPESRNDSLLVHDPPKGIAQ